MNDGKLVFDGLFDGREDVLSSRTARVTLIYLALLVLGLLLGGLWAFISEIDLSVRAPAVFRPAQGTSLTRNIVAGPVARVFVTSGEAVKRGELLWVIDGGRVVDQLAVAKKGRTEIATALDSIRQFLGFLAGEGSAASLRDPLSRARAAVYVSELRKLELLAERAKLILDRERGLPTGMTTVAKLTDLESEYELAANALESFRASSRLQSQEREQALTEAFGTKSDEVAELERSLTECEVRSQADGVCDFIRKFGNGDYLLSGEEVVRIVPTSLGRLHVDVHVGSRDVLGIRPGNRVSIRIVSSKRTELQFVSATVVSVPPDTTKLASGSMVFMVDAVLDEVSAAQAFGEILPGMEAEAQIVTGRKSVMRYLLGSLNLP